MTSTDSPSTVDSLSLLESLRALITFVWIDVGFRWVGFDRTYRWLSRATRARTRPAEEISVEEAREAFRAVQQATRFYYRRRLDCLPKALTTFRLLRLRGIPAELCLGVRKYPFSGHAWVECGGEILDDDPRRIRQYTLLKRLS